MWLRDFQYQNELSTRSEREPLLEEENSSEGPGWSLTQAEQSKLREASQALQRELAATVRHIDPSEYSQERIIGLLAQASANSNKRRKRKR